MLEKFTVSTALDNTSTPLEPKEPLSSKIPTRDLIKIIERASTLSERLGHEFMTQKLEKQQKIIDDRLEKWCQTITKGDRDQFLKRLSWDSLELDSVRDALGDVSLVERQSLPSWADTLSKAMEIAKAIATDIFDINKFERYQYLDAKNPLPFEEIYLPFIEVAKQKISQKIGSSCLLLTDRAYAQLQSGLLKQLTNLFARTLDLEFSLVRAYQGSQLIGLINKLQDKSSSKLYEEFVRDLLGDGLLAFFQEYSVLARLAAIATDFWVEATAEFLLRLADDWKRIEQNFAIGELERVVAVKTGLSDPHNCGRSVIIIQFSSDLKLVYKPKNLSLEQNYFDLLAWINQQDAVLPLKTLKIINRSTYGWIEFVEALPCQDLEAVKRYYQRAGMMLCLVYALKGTDCHQENLIANGEQPVLIDLETLLHHRTWSQEENPEATIVAQLKLMNSVATTALLPGAHTIHLAGNQQKAFDFSGLGSNDAEISVRSLKWDNINTDNMAIVEAEIDISPEKNHPFGENIDASISNHVEELITGFKQMYSFFRERQEMLLSTDSPITAFCHQKVRLVLRNTRLYASLLQNSLNPKFLRNGVERSIELDILSRSFLNSESKPANWEMAAAERQALEQLDIPYVTAYSDSTSIEINSGIIIEEFYDDSSYDDVITNLQELNQENLLEQISIIQGSFYSQSSQGQVPLDKPKVIESDRDIASLSKEEILAQAINLAEELEQSAIRGSNHSVAWLGMTHNRGKFYLNPLNYSLYDGHAGIAIFLAALAKITGNEKYADLALGSLYSLRKILGNRDDNLQTQLKNSMGIGGAKGLASIVYAFVCIAKLLDRPTLIEEAEQIATWMQIDEAVVEPKLGILDGVAGTILGLLSLYKITNQAKTLELSIAWGKYLLDRRKDIGTDRKTWLDSQGKPLTGFAEGIAGISYALLCLYASSQEAIFFTAAIDANRPRAN